MRAALHVLLTVLTLAMLVSGQSTQSVIRGRVYDARTGARFLVSGELPQSIDRRRIEDHIGRGGSLCFRFIDPGDLLAAFRACRLSAARGLRTRTPVAGRLQLDIPLRLSSDVYGQDLYSASYLPGTDAIVHTYAADLKTKVAQPLLMLLGRSGTLQSTLSYVIDPRLVRDLPLSRARCVHDVGDAAGCHGG